MKQLLFTHVILWHPTEVQVKDGQKSKIVVEPTNCLAKDLASAQLAAAMSIPEDYKEQLDHLEIVVRPF